jgi:hypothetical protein
MDCRAFRRNHLAFVDDTLPGVDIVQMQAHLNDCAKCAATDLAVRRSLLVVRNHLAPIEPSLDFTERLSARLARERLSSPAATRLLEPTNWSGVAALCGGVLMIGLLGLALGDARDSTGIAQLPAVVFTPTLPGFQTAEFVPAATPAFVATVSTGMAILPALLLAEELPVRRAQATVRRAGLTTPVPDPR